MRSKDITIGMKVIAVSKSTGQSWESWLRLLEMKRVTKEDFIVVKSWDRDKRAWVCNFPEVPGMGYFLAKDLIEWRPE